MENIFKLVAERRIQEAIDEGKFDNLPGKGKPLNLEEDMTVPAHLRVASRVLKNAGVLPDWMQLDAEIDHEQEAIRKSWERLEKEYPRRKTRAIATAKEAFGDPERRRRDFMDWLAKERASYLRAVRQVNTEITKLQMMAPSVTRVHLPYKVAEETARFDEVFESLPGVDLPTLQEPEKDEALKQTVRAMYGERLRRAGQR